MHKTTSAGNAVELHELPLEKLREFSPRIGEDVFAALRLEDALAARTHHGAASPECVRKAVQRAREELARSGNETANAGRVGDGNKDDA